MKFCKCKGRRRTLGWSYYAPDPYNRCNRCTLFFKPKWWVLVFRRIRSAMDRFEANYE